MRLPTCSSAMAEAGLIVISPADIVIAVRDLDFGKRRVSSGQPGFVKHIDMTNGWYHVIWWGDVCLVRRQDIARIL